MNTAWPELNPPEWLESCRALHLFTQVVGKTQLALAPPANHWWHVAMHLTARGLTTRPMPYGDRTLEVSFDLLDGAVSLRTNRGGEDDFPLSAPNIAEFHARYFAGLRRLGIDVAIHPLAVEIPETIYLDRDRTPRHYDPEWGRRFFTALSRVHAVFLECRDEFLGKASPVHFFWGSFDLAATRFSGRPAPLHPGGAPHCADRIMQEAYSHELSSAGFWPGSPQYPEAIFYAYEYPLRPGYEAAKVAPASAHFDPTLREFVLPYAAVREAASPEAQLRAFLRTTYEAAAESQDWPRRALERPTTLTAYREEHDGLRM